MSTNYVWQQKRTVYYVFGSFFHNQVGGVSRKNADVFVGTFYELHSQSKIPIFFDFYAEQINLLLKVELFIHILTHWNYCFISWLALTHCMKIFLSLYNLNGKCTKNYLHCSWNLTSVIRISFPLTFFAKPCHFILQYIAKYSRCTYNLSYDWCYCHKNYPVLPYHYEKSLPCVKVLKYLHAFLIEVIKRLLNTNLC